MRRIDRIEPFRVMQNIFIAGKDFASYQATSHVRFSYASGLADIQSGIRRIEVYMAEAGYGTA